MFLIDNLSDFTHSFSFYFIFSLYTFFIIQIFFLKKKNNEQDFVSVATSYFFPTAKLRV